MKAKTRRMVFVIKMGHAVHSMVFEAGWPKETTTITVDNNVMTKNGTIFAATILTGESTQSDCRNQESEIKEETRTGKISEIVQVQPR